MVDVCVLLAGCGLYDGSEPQETVVLLTALARGGARTVCVAPDVEQLHVVDHRDGNEVPGAAPRRVIEEAARLARGKVVPLSGFRPAASDALVIPGGYGVGKNLMTGFAEPGSPVQPRPPVEELVRHYLSERKPVGVISLGRLVLEAMLPEAFTARLQLETPERAYEDEASRLLYAPGFLAGDRLDRVAPGIEALAGRLIAWSAG